MQFLCKQCGQPYEWVPRGKGRPPVTCSTSCREERIRARDRADYAQRLERQRRRRRRGSPYMSVQCEVAGCECAAYSRGLCDLHYQRVRHTGEVGPAKPKKKANGLAWTDPRTGYVYIHDPAHGRRVLQHRSVMERSLGRLLLPDETVHHLNGQRDDNRIENLELWSSWQPRGQRVEDKLTWAHAIIARYEGKCD